MTPDMNKTGVANLGEGRVSGLNRARAYRVFDCLQKARCMADDGIVLYATGVTFASKARVLSLKDKLPAQVKKTAKENAPHVRSMFFRLLLRLAYIFLSPFTGRDFVIKINDARVIRQVFDALDDFLQIYFLVFGESFEQSFLEEVEGMRGAVFPLPDSVRADKRCFIYGVNCDDEVEFIYHGEQAPKELTDCL